MQPKTKQVFWEWLPGIVAGLMPLCVFAVVTLVANGPSIPVGHVDLHRMGWTAHFLVLSLVTSTVSTFMAYPRLFAYKIAGVEIGGASLGLVMVNTLILVFSATFYTIHEQHNGSVDMLVVSIVLSILAALMSLWIEFAIANLKLKQADPAS